MWIFARTIPPNWLIVAPRGIKPDSAGGYTWYPRARDQWPTLEQFDEASEAVYRFVSALPQLYNADPHQVYLMGFSQGAATAYATAIRHPHSVQGIAGLVGFIPVECGAIQESSPLMRLPIFMAAGKRDPLIPLSRTVSCAQTLYMAGAQLEYHEYDTGHRLNAQGIKDLKRWWQARLLEA
jgi:phospholipase/carboxylesterase